MSDFNTNVNALRKQIKDVATNVKEYDKTHRGCECIEGEDRGEVIANFVLAFRHLEDASMRLGKVLQAYDGGVSVYDKDTTVGA